MDELIKQLVLGAPNLIVAIAVLLWARQHIADRDAEIRRLTDVIIQLCAEEQEADKRKSGT